MTEEINKTEVESVQLGKTLKKVWVKKSGPKNFWIWKILDQKKNPGKNKLLALKICGYLKNFWSKNFKSKTIKGKKY